MAEPAVHPRHGTHDPLETTPVRMPGAVRRTSSIDMVRPEGVTAPLRLLGRARDIRTAGDGSVEPLGRAGFDMGVQFLAGREITSLETDPALANGQELIGARAASGFRARVAELLPDEQEARSLIHLLLDDVPGAALVSGYAVGAAGVRDTMKVTGYQVVPNLCSGFRSGGTIMAELATSGITPLVTGPLAPVIERTDDPDGWHQLDPMPPTGMRRRRCLDVTPLDGEHLLIVSIFRDSHCSEVGLETVIHEYEVRAVITRAEFRFLDIAATPRVLPWVECPSAAASAQRLIGRTLHDLRSEVRAEFRGITTCTHLNDQLRSLTDALVLAPSCR